MPLAEVIVGKLAEGAVARLTTVARDAGAAVDVQTSELEAALSDHLAGVEAWCSEISFRELRGSRRTEDAFIPLRVLLTPRRLAVEGEHSAKAPLESVFTQSVERPDPQTSNVDFEGNKTRKKTPARHVVILGQPGAGKTTAMKHICHRVLHDPDFYPERFRLPLVVRLREFNRRRSPGASTTSDQKLLIPTLQNLLDIRITYPASLGEPEAASQRLAIRDRAVVEVLDSLRCLLVLDGFDEIVYKTHRNTILSEIRDLTSLLQKSTVILTSRTGDYGAHIEHTEEFEISPLSKDQIANFAMTWLGEGDGVRLLNELRDSPFADTALRPLNIAHLCAIYERIGRIPDRPKTVYRKIVNLLLEDWDQQRSVERETEYGGFEVDRKFEFLANLSFELARTSRGAVFSKEDLVGAYAAIHENFGLPKGEATRVAAELENHTGLFVQAGFEHFEFSHKSLQEYLAAEFIVKLPGIPDDLRLLARLPNELAIAVAVSSRPSAYFADLILTRLTESQLDLPFYRTFVSRLLIEKPDFDRSPRVGAALVVLYSRYLERLFKSHEQLHLFVMDQLSSEFDHLASLIMDRVKPQELNRGYRLVDELEGADGQTVVRMRRRAGLRMGSIIAELPSEELYLRPALLEA